MTSKLESSRPYVLKLPHFLAHCLKCAGQIRLFLSQSIRKFQINQACDLTNMFALEISRMAKMGSASLAALSEDGAGRTGSNL